MPNRGDNLVSGQPRYCTQEMSGFIPYIERSDRMTRCKGNVCRNKKYRLEYMKDNHPERCSHGQRDFYQRKEG